jgi:non-ribosomal peptide synthetase component F
VRAVVLEAFMHQEAPFALVAAEAETLTRFNFILHNDTGERLKVPGLSISSYMIDTGRTATDLTLSVQETPAGLAATFEYDSDLFTREAVAGMLLDLQRLLACVAEDPEHTLSRLPISAA